MGHSDKIILVVDFEPSRVGGRDYSANLLFCRLILDSLRNNYVEIKLKEVTSYQSFNNYSNVIEAQVVRAFKRKTTPIFFFGLQKVKIILLEADWFLIFASWFEILELWQLKILFLWKRSIGILRPDGFLTLSPSSPVGKFRKWNVETFPLINFKKTCSRLEKLGILNSHLKCKYDFSRPIFIISPRDDIPFQDFFKAYEKIIEQRRAQVDWEILVKPHPNVQFDKSLLTEIERNIGKETINSKLELEQAALNSIPLEFFLATSSSPFYLGPYSSATSVLNSTQFNYLQSRNSHIQRRERFNYKEFERIYHP